MDVVIAIALNIFIYIEFIAIRIIQSAPKNASCTYSCSHATYSRVCCTHIVCECVIISLALQEILIYTVKMFYMLEYKANMPLGEVISTLPFLLMGHIMCMCLLMVLSSHYFHSFRCTMPIGVFNKLI